MDAKRKKRLIWQVPFLTLLIIGSILIIRQEHNKPYQHCSGVIFGTTYNITYQYDSDLHPEIMAQMLQVDSALSMFNEHSIISRINRNETVVLNDMFLEVFLMAQQVSKETDGAFDITVGPLVNAWGVGFKHDELPSDAAVDSLRQLVGYQKVSYDGHTILKQDPRITLDCSAIAKGYGVDIVARFLESKDIKNYLVEIGGEVATRGVSEKRQSWKIGVAKPSDEATTGNGELQTVLTITDKAMATSGNYRNFYYKGGRRYAHTIDPKTGRPVQHNILSATVLSDHCAQADAYATSFMVMGLQRAKQVLENHPELMAYLIYDDKGHTRIWYSTSLKNNIQK